MHSLYGQFFEGDSYILLHTIKGVDGKFTWDAFFWLGEFTTQDEAGTAAYKTVELDDYLGTSPVQHREVMHHESELFLALFPGGVHLLKGGYETGFKHVQETTYQPRLFHIKGTSSKNMRVVEVPLKTESLNSSDVFILDQGLTLWQFNGKKSHGVERNKAAQVTASIRSSRSGRPVIKVNEEGDKDLAPFWNQLGGEKAITAEGFDFTTLPIQPSENRILFKVTDSSGKLEYTKVAEGKITKQQLTSGNIFVIDSGDKVTSWVGKGVPSVDKKKALLYSCHYLKIHNKPPQTSVSRVLEGHETHSFQLLF